MSNLPTDTIISCFYGSSEDCVKVIDTDAILMSFNPNGLKAMEIDDEKDVIGKNWLSLWKNGIGKKATVALERAKSGELATFEGYCPTFKGTMKYWQVSIAPLYEYNGDILWLLVTSRDMTKQKDLEKKVARQRKEISSLKLRLTNKTALITIR